MSEGVSALLGVILLFMNGFFVAAEYSLVAARRTRIEPLVKSGNRSAKVLLKALDNLPSYIASCQVGVSLCSLALGTTFEAVIGRALERALGKGLPPGVSFAIAMLVGTFVMTVVAELVPKYFTLAHVDRVAIALARPLAFVVKIFSPLTWLVERAGAVVIRPFGIDTSKFAGEAISREELMLLIREGGTDGMLDAAHATVLSKALRFDKLDAEDIMVHRLDIRWIDLEQSKEEILRDVASTPHSRIPVCKGDIDEVQGILYVRDVVRAMLDEKWNLEQYIRAPEFIPPNLTLTRVIERMREARTQILIVSDEFGGTSGLITLEDVIEEVFGELEDQLESQRPPIEFTGKNRISAKSDVRYDELMEFLSQETDENETTDTLATLIVNGLGRVPKLGDSVAFPLGKLQVENMARRRVTRVRVLLDAPVEKA